MLVQLLTSLRGTPCIYQGEELALTEAHVPFEKLQDPYGRRFWPLYKGRDGCRTPMPWVRGVLHAGFTDGDPWLPVDPDHAEVAVDVQENDPGSPLNRARVFLAWRRTQPVLRNGFIAFHDTDEPVLAFTRDDGETALLCAFNLSSAEHAFAAPGEVSAIDVPGVEGGRLDGNTIRLAAYGVFIGALRPAA